MTERTERATILLLSGLTVLSIVGTRFAFWGDEAGTFEIVSGSWRDFFAWFASGEPHPPLYFALMKLWGAVFGYSEFALRLPSAILFPPVVYLTWKLARRFGLGRFGRMAAAMFVALHPAMWIFARMARYYVFTELLFLAATIALLDSLEKGGRRWIGYGLLVAAMLWTDFPAYLILPIHLSITLWKDKRRIGAWAIASGAALLSCAPSIYLFVRSAYSYAEDSAPSLLSATLSFAFTAYDFLIGEVRYPWQLPTALGLVAAAALYYFALRRKTRLTLLLSAMPILAGATILALLFQKLPFIYDPARLLFLLPTVAIALGAGAESIGARPRIAAVSIVVLGYLWGVSGAVSGEDYHNAVYVMPWPKIAERLDEAGVRAAISRDWGAVHYIDKTMDGILLRDALAADLPDGRVAHVWRSGAFKLLEIDSLVQQRLQNERGEAIDTLQFVPENPKIKRLKKRVMGLNCSDNLVRVFIFAERKP